MEQKIEVEPVNSGSITLPALVINRDGMIGFESFDFLTECNRLGLKRGYYEGLELVDSLGQRFKVVETRKIGRPAFKWEHLIDILTGNPRYRVELLFSPEVRSISVAELKDIFLQSFDRDGCVWEEIVDFEELQEGILNAGTMSDIFATYKAFNMM